MSNSEVFGCANSGYKFHSWSIMKFIQCTFNNRVTASMTISSNCADWRRFLERHIYSVFDQDAFHKVYFFEPSWCPPLIIRLAVRWTLYRGHMSSSLRSFTYHKKGTKIAWRIPSQHSVSVRQGWGRSTRIAVVGARRHRTYINFRSISVLSTVVGFSMPVSYSQLNCAEFAGHLKIS